MLQTKLGLLKTKTDSSLIQLQQYYLNTNKMENLGLLANTIMETKI